MSLTLLLCEVEKDRRRLASGPAFRELHSLSTFGSFAALGLHSCRALSSAGCARNLTLAGTFRKAWKAEGENVLPIEIKCVTHVLSQKCYRCPDCTLRPAPLQPLAFNLQPCRKSPVKIAFLHPGHLFFSRERANHPVHLAPHPADPLSPPMPPSPGSRRIRATRQR